MAVGGRKLFERKAWNLCDHIVDGRFERSRRGAPGDVVAQLVERVADGQLGRYLGNRKTRGLGRQRRRARHARVHLDHDHAAIDRVDRELHIRAASVHTNLAQHGQRCVAQNLVFLVGQGLGRGHGDRVAGVHAHRVKVLNRANDDAVVRLVAHHFHLELFPAQQRLFDQQFAGGRCLQTALADGFELFRVVGNAAAGAAQRKTRANDGWKAHFLLHRPGLVHVVGNARARRLQADAGHGVLELQTVFGLVDGFGRCANQLHLVLVQYAVVPQVECAVERGLAAHGRQDGVGALLGNDLLDRLPGDGLDVGDIGGGRVGHDRGRVAVDQDDLVALLAQRLAGLHAGVVKLAGLANDDRAGANDQDAFDVSALRHLCGSPSVP